MRKHHIGPGQSISAKRQWSYSLFVGAEQIKGYSNTLPMPQKDDKLCYSRGGNPKEATVVSVHTFAHTGLDLAPIVIATED